MAYRNYSTAVSHIVDATGQGDFTTIAAALAAATSGQTIFIRPGTYTENVTLVAGVNLTATDADSSLNSGSNVIIKGTCSFSSAGTVTIAGVQLQTNSANFLSVTGSAASIVNLNNCFLNCTNNTGITFSTNNASAQLNLYRCNGNLGTTGIAFFSDSSTGSTNINHCNFGNSGSSTTANTKSAGSLFINFTIWAGPITHSTSGASVFILANFDCSAINTTCVTTSGTGSIVMVACSYGSGSASGLSVGAGTTVNLQKITVNSSNTNAVTGAGTINYSDISVNSATGKQNVSTANVYSNISGPITFDSTNYLSNYSEGTFVPTMLGGSTAGATTYSIQNGFYRRIGKLVVIQVNVTGSAATGTGAVTFGAFPFTINSQLHGECQGAMLQAAATPTWVASTTMITAFGAVNTTTCSVWCSGSGTGGGQLQISNSAFNYEFTLAYEV